MSFAKSKVLQKALLLSVVGSQIIFAGGDVNPVKEAVFASVAESFSFISNVQAHGELRPRYEYVKTNNATGNASVFTNRLMLSAGADLLTLSGLSVYLEAINVSTGGNYWDLSNVDIGDKNIYNIVTDPSQTRITQAYIDYTFGKTFIRTGRQGVNLDNQRFIGTVNWRQMPQTYDAVSLSNHSIGSLSVMTAYVWHVNTIFDSNTVKPIGSGYDTRTVLLHASYKLNDAFSLTAYGYMIEDIHDTYGVVATGKFAFGESTGLSYRAEYAKQINPTFNRLTTNKTADASYYNLEATLNMSGFLSGVRYEVLGAGAGTNASFSTPLATLHGQNGWADLFLTTPTSGLVDMNGMIGYKTKGFGVAKIVYHSFSSDKGNTKYGREADILYKNKISAVKGLSGFLKASFYNADTFKVDTTKYWVMLDYKF